MGETRKKSMSILYNGIEAQKDLSPYLEKFSYTDSVDESDKISMAVSDRGLKWVKSWIPVKGDLIQPSVSLGNWNYEGEKITMSCGAFIVDDFSFSAPPLRGEINGVSAPVDTGFKETSNSKTWEAATVQLIAAEIASKYGLSLVYEAGDIQIKKTEQSDQADSDFLKKLCEKYGLGLKIYSNRLVIWDFKQYFLRPEIMKLTVNMVTKWSYKSTMQGTYTGAKVSYTAPGAKKPVEIIVGTAKRLYKTTQKADDEADARLIGEAAVRNANRKETTMQITLPPQLSLYATGNILITGFGKMDGKYFVERVTHSVGRKSYDMQLSLSKIPDSEAEAEKPNGAVNEDGGTKYVVKKMDTLWDISARFYGRRSPTLIYEANKDVIEEAARKAGRKDSSGGSWIYPGTVLKIPRK